MNSADSSAGPLVVVSAGDLSGDLHASYLVERLRDEWKSRHPVEPQLRFAAAGSYHLKNAGVEIWEDTTFWGAMGIFEGIKILPALLFAKRRMINRIRKEKPEIVIPVDYRSFNMSLLKDIRVRRDGTKQKIAYYISPVLWGKPKTNTGRKAVEGMVEVARKLPGGKGARDRFDALAELADLALVAYPFSLEHYRRAGVNFRYIGHPLAQIAREIAKQEKYLSIYKEKIQDKRLVGIAPGSRVHELNYHMPVLRELLTLLKQRYDNLWFYCPVPGEKLEKLIRKGFGEHADSIEFVPDDCYDLMESSDLLIFKSGTSVQLGLLLAVPTVAFYKICGETLEKIARQFFMDLPFYTMPNLLAGREVIKEFIQTKFTLPNLYVACTELLDDPAQSGHLRAELAELRKATIEPDPIGESSRLICDLIDS